MSGKTIFRRREVPSAVVVQAESAAAVAPITGDPRLPAAGANLAAVQGRGPIYTLGQVAEVPLERIKPNPVNPRVVYTAQAVDDMAQSLAKDGQLVAATGYVDGDFVTLIEGETRLRGARAAGLPVLRIEIKPRPENDQLLYRNARDANVRRREQTPLDDAVKWTELIDKKIFASQAEIATALEISESTVSRTLALAAMPQAVMYRLADYPSLHSFQMLNAIREYWTGFGDEKTLDYIPQIVKNGWGYRRVAADAAAANRGPVRRPRGSKEDVVYAGAKGEIKTFAGGRLEVSFKGLPAEKAQELVARIKEFCGQP